jgi:hypothetical protein
MQMTQQMLCASRIPGSQRVEKRIEVGTDVIAAFFRPLIVPDFDGIWIPRRKRVPATVPRIPRQVESKRRR